MTVDEFLKLGTTVFEENLLIFLGFKIKGKVLNRLFKRGN